LVTGRALLHPSIPDLTKFPGFAYAFDQVEPVLPSGATRTSTADAVSAARARPQTRVKAKPPAKTRPTHYRLLAVPSDAREDISVEISTRRGFKLSKENLNRDRVNSSTELFTGNAQRHGVKNSTEILNRKRVILDEAPLPQPVG
jgi:hypothetical protein